MDKNKKNQRSVLGRGLSALISTPPVSIVPPTVAKETPAVVDGNQAIKSEEPVNNVIEISSSYNKLPIAGGGLENEVQYVLIETVFPNPKQPRQVFQQAEITELSDSIKTLGVLQPILVRKVGDRHEIVAGERRWRASQAAGLTKVPVIVKNLSERETLEVALVENIQRSNLSPIEEAQAYQRLADEFSLSQREIAERVGKDRASVANYLRLLSLPEGVIDLLKAGSITMGHAKAILTVKEPSVQNSLARKVIDEGLSVRALEAIVSRVVVLDTGRRGGKSSRDTVEEKGHARSDFPEVTDRLRESLGTKVSIRHHESGRGRIEIEYFSEQELDRLVEFLTRV